MSSARGEFSVTPVAQRIKSGSTGGSELHKLCATLDEFWFSSCSLAAILGILQVLDVLSVLEGAMWRAKAREDFEDSEDLEDARHGA